MLQKSSGEANVDAKTYLGADKSRSHVVFIQIMGRHFVHLYCWCWSSQSRFLADYLHTTFETTHVKSRTVQLAHSCLSVSQSSNAQTQNGQSVSTSVCSLTSVCVHYRRQYQANSEHLITHCTSPPAPVFCWSTPKHCTKRTTLLCTQTNCYHFIFDSRAGSRQIMRQCVVPNLHKWVCFHYMLP